VFSAEKYKGNRLAILAVRGNVLSQAKKQLIAREFGFSETVFLHDAPGDAEWEEYVCDQRGNDRGILTECNRQEP